jgi:hypothetical protein
MKTLQNNFTTPEQSKRLLELGVPADSADCYYQDYGSIPMLVWTETQPLNLRRGILKPCWSVGRMMEICKICGSYKLAKEIYGRALMYLNTVDGCICEMSYEINKGNLDFSELEE